MELPEEIEEEEEVPETPQPVVLRQCTLITGDPKEVDPDFPIGLFEVPVGEPPEIHTSAIILIGEVEGKLVAALPFAAWHRVAAKRLLPNGSLLKPIAVQAEFVDRAPGAGEASAVLKVWLGVLAPDFEGNVTFDATVETTTPDVSFDPDLPTGFPTAESLAALFDQHFAFTSATSGAEPKKKNPRSANPSTSELDQRLQSLEQSVASIATSLKDLAGTPTRPAALRKPTGAANPDPPCKPPGLERVAFAETEKEFDLVKAAREAGVPEEQVRQMAAIAAKGKPKLLDFPLARAKPKARADPLSESEEEGIPEVEEQELAEEAPSSNHPTQLSKAISKLTEIASHLTSQRRQNRTLEALLDGGAASGTEGGSSGVTIRKYSAALRALRKTLHTNPQELYKVMERNMEEDFQMRTQLPGSTPTMVSARAWLELRSRVQNYQTPVRLLWGIAGVADCLRANQVDQARARCMLLLAMGDQLSIDRGTWVLAAEMSLEEPPPLSAFANHPLPGELEAPHTRLVDGRWVDLFLAKLNDYENLADKKRKLGYRKNPKPGDPSSETVPPKAEPKKKGGGKGKGKHSKSDAGGDGSAEAGNPA